MLSFTIEGQNSHSSQIHIFSFVIFFKQAPNVGRLHEYVVVLKR